MELKPLLEKTVFSKSLPINIRKFWLSKISSVCRKALLVLTNCDLCGLSCQKYLQLCHYCHQDLPLFQYQTVQGDLLNWPAIHQHLPAISFDHLICLAPHQQPFNHWISQLKYNGRFEIAKLLGHLLADNFSTLLNKQLIEKPDMVIAVPLHLNRWQKRGFNQAHLIAKYFIKECQPMAPLNYCPEILSRPKKTEQQVGQSGAQRRKNLKVLKNYPPVNVRVI
jgi:predicted amidophosphoribosyltransferase